MGIINDLRKIKDLDTSNFSNLNYNYKNIVINNFINNLGIDLDLFKVKPSVGTGQLADMWWIGVFNRDYYKRAYQSKNDSQIGASKGYYVVYLFNKDRTCLYLTLAQASSGISSNKDKLSMMIERNKYLQEFLFSDLSYLKDIHNALSDDKTQMARDYEYAVILAKKYDLNLEINDFEFKEDIHNFLNQYEKLINFIYSNPIILTDTFVLDTKHGITVKRKRKIFSIEEYVDNEVDQAEIQGSKFYQNEDEIDESNNRTPKLISSNHERYYRDARLSKTVLVKKNFICDVDSSHKTFTTNSNHQYSEAHHLIPMKFQKDYPSINLDRSDNIVSLCPICHNAIHYGNEKEILERLKVLYETIYMKSDLRNSIQAENYIELYNIFY